MVIKLPRYSCHSSEMTRGARSCVVAVVVLLFMADRASSAKLREHASTEQSVQFRPGLSASNGVLGTWNAGLPSSHNYHREQYDWERRTVFEYNRTIESTVYTYEDGIRLTKWAIAVIIIVPLLLLVGIVVFFVCVCKVCSGKKAQTTHRYQEAPPPYAVNATMNIGGSTTASIPM